MRLDDTHLAITVRSPKTHAKLAFANPTPSTVIVVPPAAGPIVGQTWTLPTRTKEYGALPMH